MQKSGALLDVKKQHVRRELPNPALMNPPPTPTSRRPRLLTKPVTVSNHQILALNMQNHRVRQTTHESDFLAYLDGVGDEIETVAIAGVEMGTGVQVVRCWRDSAQGGVIG